MRDSEKNLKQTFMERARLLWDLCVLDMKQRSAGTALGILWIYLTPAVSMVVIWFVFQFGIRNGEGAPQIYSLLIGLIAWQIVSDSIIAGTGAFIERPYLIKKIRFPVALLPFIKVINSFWIHLPFLLAAIAISVFYGEFSFLRLLLYFISLPVLFIFLTATVFLLSTIAVFYRDIQSVLGVVIQLLFWATPIIWIVPKNYPGIEAVESVNPFYVVVEFYRYCFLGQMNISLHQLLPFVILLGLVCFTSKKVFTILKDQFSDVL